MIMRKERDSRSTEKRFINDACVLVSDAVAGANIEIGEALSGTSE